MRSASKKKPAYEKFEGAERVPEVIVDFDCKQDLLYVVIANVGLSSAHRISIEFDKEITDFRGRRLSQLDVFHHLEFLAPGKKIIFFVDDLAKYIKRKQPLRIAFSITYFDRNSQSRTDHIRHNLAVYKDLVVPDESSQV
jgi:predicted MPP superfamily phosphohydrolase